MLVFLYINFWLLKPQNPQTRNYFMLSKHRKWGEKIEIGSLALTTTL